MSFAWLIHTRSFSPALEHSTHPCHFDTSIGLYDIGFISYNTQVRKSDDKYCRRIFYFFKIAQNREVIGQIKKRCCDVIIPLFSIVENLFIF